MVSAAESLGYEPRVLPAWPRRRWACALRAVIQALLLVPIVRSVCRPLRVRGLDRLPEGPAVYVANHASHADTALILAALPGRFRRHLAPAAAEDYFFSSRAKGLGVELAIGAFAFPRSGSDGIARARRLLGAGWSVLIFPEGTRSRTGEIARFRSGAGVLAGLGYPVVPVGVSGTRDVLGAGTDLPRQRPVAVVFGEAEYLDAAGSPQDVAVALECSVRTLVARADRERPPARVTWFERARRLATSRAGLALLFAWGAAEALAWPIVPDAVVALLAVAAPRRALVLASAAVAGSVAGGLGAYALGSLFGSGLLEHLPMVTERMIEAVSGWFAVEGGAALRHQPLSGVPFKVFGLQAADHGVGVGAFAWGTVLARAPRIVLVGAAFGGLGAITRRRMPRFYGVFAVLFAAVFTASLAHVVRSWS